MEATPPIVTTPGRRRAALVAMAVSLMAAACSGPTPKATTTTASTPPASTPVPAPPAITKSTFEPVYRSAKAIQGAVASGVTHQRFSELLQAFATENAIAKDQKLTDADVKLLAAFQEVFDHYHTSSTIWSMKISASDDIWKGEIPFSFKDGGNPEPILDIAQRYGIPIVDRKVQYTGALYKAMPGDAVQYIWRKADESLQQATDIYYGR